MAELPAAVTSLVDAALRGDDPERLVAAAARELGTPLGLVGSSGEALGWAPGDASGQRALTVATAAARSGLVAPPGWRIESVSRGAARLGYLAVGGDAGRAMLDFVVALLADQLHRRELLRGRAGAFLRSLVTEPSPAARREGAELGVALADAYWPAVLTWRRAAPRAGWSRRSSARRRAMVRSSSASPAASSSCTPAPGRARGSRTWWGARGRWRRQRPPRRWRRTGRPSSPT